MATVNNTQNGLTFAQLNDTQKQRIAAKFLDVHPTRLNNSIVEYILRKSWDDQEAPFCYDDITNNEPTANICVNGSWDDYNEADRDELLEELQEKLEELQEQQTELEDNDQPVPSDLLEAIEALENDIEALKEVTEFEDYPEIYQWFSCSDWFIRALEEKGQCTLDDEFWGRQACGQSITLDQVVQEIAFDWFCNYGETTLSWNQIVELGL